ncbi:CAP domain-containing protein [Flavitalea flava]
MRWKKISALKKIDYVLIICLMISVQFGVSLPGFSQDRGAVYQDTTFINAVLNQHNQYRTALNLPPLAWSPDLASDALNWAQHLAKTDQGAHDMSIRGKEGENIWWGTTGGFTPTEMVGFWGNEKKDFVYGIFPDCSTSKSAVVGHYTQIIWKTTTSVGCALVSNKKKDFLVCRYSPPGNRIGAKPY